MGATRADGELDACGDIRMTCCRPAGPTVRKNAKELRVSTAAGNPADRPRCAANCRLALPGRPRRWTRRAAAPHRVEATDGGRCSGRSSTPTRRPGWCQPHNAHVVADPRRSWSTRTLDRLAVGGPERGSGCGCVVGRLRQAMWTVWRAAMTRSGRRAGRRCRRRVGRHGRSKAPGHHRPR